MSVAFSAMPTKETAACCRAARDALGRPPIGFCGRDCERRRARDALLQYRLELGMVVRTGCVFYEQWPSWEPGADEWDDPTSAAVLASSHLAGPS